MSEIDELKEEVDFYRREWETACERNEYTQEMTEELIELRKESRYVSAYVLIMGAIFIISIFASIANAYEVNAYQATEKDKTVLEIVDDCNKSYKLLVKTDELGSDKTLKWFETIINRSDFCLDK